MQNLRQKTYLMLRKSEAFFKTDMVYLAKGGSWLTLNNVVSMIVGLALSIGFANLLPKESFGTYKYILSLAGVLGAFSLTGLSTTVIRSVALGFEGSLKKGFLLGLKWSFLVFAGGLIAAIYYFINENNTLALSMLIIGSFSPFIASASLYGSFLEGKKDFKVQTIYGIARNITPTLLLFFTIFATENPLIIVLVYFGANAFITLLLYFKTLKRYRPATNIDVAMESYSKHLSLMNILGELSGHIDKVLVFHFLGAGPLAVYTFAIAPVNQLQVIKKLLRTLALPKLSAQNLSRLRSSVPQKVLTLLLVYILIITIYILIAPLFYKLLFPQYVESIFYSQLYALVLLFAPTMLFVETLVAHQKKVGLYIIRIASPIIKIILFLVLLPLFGLMGLIAALILSKLASTVLTIFIFKKIHND